MKLDGFVRAVRRYWVTFAAVSGTVFLAAVAAILLMPATFVSNTQLLVSVSGTTTATAYQNDDVVAGRINSYLALITSDVVSQRVVDTLGLPITSAELSEKVTATNVAPRTAVIDIAVTDSSADGARLLADTVAAEFISYAAALETPTGEDDQKVRATVVSAASEPQHRGTEKVALAGLGLLGALLLGAVAVWVRTWLDPVVRTADRAAESADLPVIGQVTVEPGTDAGSLDAYRRLRTRLRSALTDGVSAPESPGRVLVLASPVGEVDVAQVATSLGGVFEMAGSRAVVVDVGAAVPAEPDTEEQAGAEDQADDESAEPTATSEVNGAALAGQGDARPALLQMSTWATDPDEVATPTSVQLLDRLRTEHEYVIISVPSVLSTITASALSEHADGVVVLVSPETTKRTDLRRAVADLRETGAPLIGTLLAGKPDIAPGADPGSTVLQDSEQ